VLPIGTADGCLALVPVVTASTRRHAASNVSACMLRAFDTLIAERQNGTGQAGVVFRPVDSADRAVFLNRFRGLSRERRMVPNRSVCDRRFPVRLVIVIAVIGGVGAVVLS